MKRHRWFLGFILCAGTVLGALLLHGQRILIRDMEAGAPRRRAIVESLQLTDLALWTEARYTRHLSQADLFTPFQEFASSLEHFPTGSFTPPRKRIGEPGSAFHPF